MAERTMAMSLTPAEVVAVAWWFAANAIYDWSIALKEQHEDYPGFSGSDWQRIVEHSSDIARHASNTYEDAREFAGLNVDDLITQVTA